eukprot:gene305-422_t
MAPAMRLCLLAAAVVVQVNAQCALPSGLSGNTPDKNNRNFVNCHGRLRLSGIRMVDESGNYVQLQGMSSHGLHWYPQCYSKDSIQFLVEHWGINVFRASMYVGEGGYATDPSVKNKLKDVVQWCKELGIYVIIDWHMLSPGNPLDPVYSGASAFFAEVSNQYQNDPNVLYEICNEPNYVDWATVKRYADGIINTIRANDPNGLILVGTPTWSQEIDKPASNPVAKAFNV